MIEKVDDQSFDVRSVMILNSSIAVPKVSTYLIRHDHQMPIPQVVGGSVVLIVFESKDLLDVLNLDVFHNLIVTSLSNIE